jgi:RHS repeat-associated protein
MFFTGKQWDADAGLYYFNARWYDADSGRFITQDPIKDQLNWYNYCLNNPLRYIDQHGLKTQATEVYPGVWVDHNTGDVVQTPDGSGVTTNNPENYYTEGNSNKIVIHEANGFHPRYVTIEGEDFIDYIIAEDLDNYVIYSEYENINNEKTGKTEKGFKILSVKDGKDYMVAMGFISDPKGMNIMASEEAINDLRKGEIKTGVFEILAGVGVMAAGILVAALVRGGEASGVVLIKAGFTFTAFGGARIAGANKGTWVSDLGYSVIPAQVDVVGAVFNYAGGEDNE